MKDKKSQKKTARTLTEQDQRHRRRLVELVDSVKRDDISRDLIGAACGMTGNGVTQYYLGLLPLKFDAALAFSLYFRVPTEQLYEPAGRIVLSSEQARLIDLLREIPEEKYQRIEQLLEGIAAKN